ncbi:MAG: CoA-binding protein [Aigarchaeota archaeon]|nr:CoA-binding protein [Aigarchaeota archaeon]MDW8093218.1 CoA-binding protein [Nitrososphaerota archaeon]
MTDIPTDGLSDAELLEILRSSKRVAVVGMSRDESKPAHYVPRYLFDHGYTIYPVNPMTDSILSLKVYKSLLEVPRPIDIVDVFRPSDQVYRVAVEAVSVGPRVFWLQEGIYNEDAVRLVKSKGIRAVWNRCMMREHARLVSK